MSPAEKLKQDYLTEQEVAEFLGCKPKSLRNDRSEGKNHPPYLRFGRVVKYPAKDFAAWVAKHKVVRSVS